MPLTYDIDPRHGIVFSQWTGVVSYSDIVENARRLRSDPKFQDSFSELLDMSGFQGTDATFASLNGFADRADPFAANSRRAVVAPSKIAFGIARMYQTVHGDDSQFQLFENVEDARHWLGLD
jgi:hypothetical protein